MIKVKLEVKESRRIKLYTEVGLKDERRRKRKIR